MKDSDEKPDCGLLVAGCWLLVAGCWLLEMPDKRILPLNSISLSKVT
jgi:hypothetical protein